VSGIRAARRFAEKRLRPPRPPGRRAGGLLAEVFTTEAGKPIRWMHSERHTEVAFDFIIICFESGQSVRRKLSSDNSWVGEQPFISDALQFLVGDDPFLRVAAAARAPIGGHPAEPTPFSNCPLGAF
jgi:hypothetical protein